MSSNENVSGGGCSPGALNLTTSHSNQQHHLNQLASLKQQEQLNILRRLNLLQQQQQQQLQLNTFHHQQQQSLIINFDNNSSGNSDNNSDQRMIIDDDSNCVVGYTNDDVMMLHQDDHHLITSEEKSFNSANSIGPKNLKKLFIKRYRKSLISVLVKQNQIAHRVIKLARENHNINIIMYTNYLAANNIHLSLLTYFSSLLNQLLVDADSSSSSASSPPSNQQTAANNQKNPTDQNSSTSRISIENASTTTTNSNNSSQQQVASNNKRLGALSDNSNSKDTKASVHQLNHQHGQKATISSGQTTPPQPPCSISPTSSTSSAISSSSSTSPIASSAQVSARNSVTPPGSRSGSRRCGVNGQASSPLPPSPADSGVSDVDSHYSSNDEHNIQNAKQLANDKLNARLQQANATNRRVSLATGAVCVLNNNNGSNDFSCNNQQQNPNGEANKSVSNINSTTKAGANQQLINRNQTVADNKTQKNDEEHQQKNQEIQSTGTSERPQSPSSPEIKLSSSSLNPASTTSNGGGNGLFSTSVLCKYTDSQLNWPQRSESSCVH